MVYKYILPMLIQVIIFFTSKEIQRLWTSWKQCEQTERVVCYPPDSPLIRNLKLIICVFIIACLLVYCAILSDVYLFICVLLCFAMNLRLHKKSRAEISLFLQRNYLDIGYGAALCYYHSYMKLFVPDHLNQRMKQFKSYHNVDVSPKLFILFPKSGKVQKYIDNIENYIERCTEVQVFKTDHAGVKDRTINLTVYHIRSHTNGRDIRCAIEYAMPLKAMMAFKNKNAISESEISRQRIIFFNALKELLKDENDSYKYFELIMFDDEREEIHDVILERNSRISQKNS